MQQNITNLELSMELASKRQTIEELRLELQGRAVTIERLEDELKLARRVSVGDDQASTVSELDYNALQEQNKFLVDKNQALKSKLYETTEQLLNSVFAGQVVAETADRVFNHTKKMYRDVLERLEDANYDQVRLQEEVLSRPSHIQLVLGFDGGPDEEEMTIDLNRKTVAGEWTSGYDAAEDVEFPPPSASFEGEGSFSQSQADYEDRS